MELAFHELLHNLRLVLPAKQAYSSFSQPQSVFTRLSSIVGIGSFGLKTEGTGFGPDQSSVSISPQGQSVSTRLTHKDSQSVCICLTTRTVCQRRVLSLAATSNRPSFLMLP